MDTDAVVSERCCGITRGLQVWLRSYICKYGGGVLETVEDHGDAIPVDARLLQLGTVRRRRSHPINDNVAGEREFKRKWRQHFSK